MAEIELQFVEVTKEESGKTSANCTRCRWGQRPAFDYAWVKRAAEVHETMLCEHRDTNG